METEYISRQEHEEFRRSMESENQRLEDENNRQNHRLQALEETVKQAASISTEMEMINHLIYVLRKADESERLYDWSDQKNPTKEVDIYALKQTIRVLEHYAVLLRKPLCELVPSMLFDVEHCMKNLGAL